ncbi:MAG: hypothetical protein QOC55_806 [Thermoleophilaceae bacterium]|jgi:hypothetical protein|nr:hypothetical protein [Thermoleophilaceae bacterium]
MNPRAAAAAAEFAAAARRRAARAREAARNEHDPDRLIALQRAIEIHECAASTQERAVNRLLRSGSAIETRGRASRWSARHMASVILPPPPPDAKGRAGIAAGIAETFIDALVNRDLEAMLSCVSEDVYFVAGGDYGGHSGVRRWWAIDSLDRPQRHLLELVELDDTHVFAEICTSRANGTRTQGSVYTVGADGIEAIELFADADHAYRARDVVPG